MAPILRILNDTLVSCQHALVHVCTWSLAINYHLLDIADQTNKVVISIMKSDKI